MTTPDDDEDLDAGPERTDTPLTTDPEQQDDDDLDPNTGEGGAG
jgi:hypothetical protein